MRKFLVVLAMCGGLGLWAQQMGHVVSHNGETIVTDPSKGANSYKKWAVFPDWETPIRRMILNLTFECPDKMRCADWDYVDHIKARAKHDTVSYEIARMLTPYGGRFQEDWKFRWKVDVSDFLGILRDSVEIDYIHTGYEDNKTRGWKVTVDFEMEYGRPAAEILALHKIYDGNYNYGNAEDPIENHLVPVPFTTAPGTAFAKIKAHQTGHGMDAEGCGEFCSKYRNILLNGTVIDSKDLWTECGDNPLYPQAGTWIFDRANWCPGYLLQPDEVIWAADPETPYTVDFDMEPFTVEKPSAKELLAAYVIEYGRPSAAHDATLVDILSPSTEDVYARMNPNPHAMIRIGNSGREPLKKLHIDYRLEGTDWDTYTWEGNLPFGETATLTLPGVLDTEADEALFTVHLKRPNGKRDGYSGDNEKSAVYKAPPVLPEDLIVYLRTNNKPHENSYRIRDGLGNAVFARDSLELEAATAYSDTLHLAPGNYTFEVDDHAGDGLEFWFKADAGRGTVRLQDTLGRALKHFGSDFGSGIFFNFKVRPDARYTLDDTPAISVFPARTDGPVTLDYFTNGPKEVRVVIAQQDDAEKIVEEHLYKGLTRASLQYDLSYLPKMRYYIKVYIDGEEVFKNRIRLKE